MAKEVDAHAEIVNLYHGLLELTEIVAGINADVQRALAMTQIHDDRLLQMTSDVAELKRRRSEARAGVQRLSERSQCHASEDDLGHL